MALDAKMQCLCCNCAVLVDLTEWRKLEMPIALCPSCHSTVPKAVIHTLFIVRSQVATLMNDLTLVRRDVKNLFAAQQDLEQALHE